MEEEREKQPNEEELQETPQGAAEEQGADSEARQPPPEVPPADTDAAGSDSQGPKIVEGTEMTGAPEEESQVLDQEGIDTILNEIERGGTGGTEGTAFDLPDVPAPPGEEAEGEEPDLKQIELLKDVHVKVRVELGRGAMLLRDILKLREGSVVELEKLAGDPLDIYVNDRLIAKGEVLVLNENFCIRVTEIFSPQEVLRLKG